MTDVSTMPPPDGAAETIGTSDLETMERYGITRVPAAHYLVGPYRYSNLADALAEAKRRTMPL